MEFAEWACRTYGYTPKMVLDEIPVAHLAVLYRCYAHGSGMCKSGTFQEDDLFYETTRRLDGCGAKQT